MKNILIGGCSFSETHGYTEKINYIWNNDIDNGVPWADFLKVDYKDKFNIINRSRGSFGQSKIVESLLSELIKRNFDIDYVIVQWSAVGRGYESNEKKLLKRLLKEDIIDFSVYSHEYLIKNEKEGFVTDLMNNISKSYYIASLNQIFLFKTLLKTKNIPYKMFWGWCQISPEIESDVKYLLNLIYDEHFWRHNDHGGMSEYIMENIGKHGFKPNDFHPSTKGHKYFYNNIIKNIIDKI